MYFAKNRAESDASVTEKADSLSGEQQHMEASAQTTHKEQAGATRGSSGNSMQDAKTDAIQAWYGSSAQRPGHIDSKRRESLLL